MYASSGAFKTAVKQSHTAIAKAEVWTSDQLLQVVNIQAGNVTVNSSMASRRECEIEIVTNRTITNLVPDNDFDVITPFGNELRLYRGIKFDNGTEEYVPLGVFVITEVAVQDSNEGVTLSLTGSDRSLLISRAKWIEPYQVENASLESAITALLKSRYPDVQTAFPTTNVTINQVVLGSENDNDPWKDAVELCELVGFDLFFNANGVVEMAQFPSLDGSVVVSTFVEGVGTTVTSIDRSISTKETFNGVVYTIEGTDVATPIRVEAWDEDSTSPTYRFGKFGQVPTFVETSLLSTEDEAVRAAAALLNKYIGAQETISWECIPDPTLDVNDVVYVKAVGAKVDRLVIIDKIDLPLDPQDTMTVDARTVRVVAEGEEVVVGA
jgi:hypothetical protein